MRETDVRRVNLLTVILYTATFLPAGLGKVLEGQAPEWFLNQFGPTFLNLFPGSLTAAYLGIGLGELIVSLIFLGSLRVRPLTVRTDFFRLGLLGATAIFIVLAFGQRITHQYDPSASLFFYAAFSIVIFLLTGGSRHDTRES